MAEQGKEIKLELKKHPEWKQLLEEIAPHITHGRSFTYDELSKMACGLDIQSTSGRKQFLRFRRAAQRAWNVWFENVRNEGYRIVPANEHGVCATKRVSAARRKIKTAHAIATHVAIEKLTEAQRINNTQLMAVTGALLQALTQQAATIKTIAAKIESPKIADATASTLEAFQSGRMS